MGATIIDFAADKRRFLAEGRERESRELARDPVTRRWIEDGIAYWLPRIVEMRQRLSDESLSDGARDSLEWELAHRARFVATSRAVLAANPPRSR